MTEPIPDTWHTRDLPVLRAIIRQFDTSDDSVVRAEVVESITGLEAPTVQRAGKALREAGLVDMASMSGLDFLWAKAVSGEARRLAGSWPGPDAVADRLLAALNDVAEHGSDPVEKAKARKALEALGGFSRDLLVSVAGAAAGVAMQ